MAEAEAVAAVAEAEAEWNRSVGLLTLKRFVELRSVPLKFAPRF